MAYQVQIQCHGQVNWLTHINKLLPQLGPLSLKSLQNKVAATTTIRLRLTPYLSKQSQHPDRPSRLSRILNSPFLLFYIISPTSLEQLKLKAQSFKEWLTAQSFDKQKQEILDNWILILYFPLEQIADMQKHFKKYRDRTSQFIGKEHSSKIFLLHEVQALSKIHETSSQLDKELLSMKYLMNAMVEQSAHSKITFFMEMLPTLQIKATQNSQHFSTYILLTYKALSIYRNLRHFPFAIELHDALYFTAERSLSFNQKLLSQEVDPPQFAKIRNFLNQFLVETNVNQEVEKQIFNLNLIEIAQCRASEMFVKAFLLANKLRDITEAAIKTDYERSVVIQITLKFFRTLYTYSPEEKEAHLAFLKFIDSLRTIFALYLDTKVCSFSGTFQSSVANQILSLFNFFKRVLKEILQTTHPGQSQPFSDLIELEQNKKEQYEQETKEMHHLSELLNLMELTDSLCRNAEDTMMYSLACNFVETLQLVAIYDVNSQKATSII